MGFEFGSVAHLDVQVTLISFVCVILFIIIFDMGTGILEYFLEGSKLYGKIVQTIYKELMLMGLVSFIIVISEGAQTTAVSNSTTGHDWFQAVDFSHMLLFFVTFFFVIHALYLLRSSIIAGNKYKYTFGLTTTELIESIEHVNKYSLSKFFYEFDFLPLSSIREKVEFRLIYIVFRDAYSLPEDFHFAYYLSGCFDRYALRTTNRSMVTWVILILLAICNFVRIALDIGFSSCSSVGDDDVTTGNSTDISHHRLLFEDRDDHLRRLSGSTASTGHVGYESNMCRSNLVKLFLLAGLLLCLYCLIIVFFSRLYKLRIIRKTGLRNTDDYYDFLKFVAEEEERMKLSIKNEEIHKRELRKRNRALKMDIEHVLDDDEAGGEEAEFKEIAEFLARSYSDIRDFISDSILSIRLLIYSITSSKATEGKTGLLQQLQNVSDSAIEVEKDNNETNQEVREGEKTSDDHQNPAPGQRKAMLHLHRSSTRQSHDFGGNGGAFFKQVQTRVMNGKDDILKRLTVSKSTPSSHNASMSKIQPDPSEGPSSLSAANENSLSSNSSPRGSEKTLIQRQRSTTINVQSISSKSGRRSMTPVQGPAAKAGLTRLAGKRNSAVLDSSVVAFLNSQLNAQPAANSTTQGNAGGRGGGPRRGSVVLQKLNAAHNAVQNELSSPTEATKGTDFENAPLADNDLGLIQRYRIYRSGRKKNRMGTVNSVSSITPIMQAGSSSSKTDRPSESFQDRVFNWIDRISAWMGQRQVTKQKSTNSSSKVGKDLESGEKRSETEEDSLMVESLDDFSDIYLFRSAVFFYRSVEMCIMFNCLYFAFWMTDFAVIASWIEQPNFWKISTEIGMIIPAFVLFPCVGSIAETCSMIGALSQLNLEVIHEVLLEAENTRLLMIDLRKKMLARIKALETTNANVVDTVHQLFDEVDEKKNGWIDKFHFRLLLRTLKLTFSDERFNRLYRAVDSSGDGMIEWAELHELLFGHLDEKEGVVGGGNDGHHRDSLSSDRMSILDTSEKNHIVRSGLTAPAIQEEDEDDDDSDSDEEEEEDEEDDDERSSRSAFSRKNSRYSNPSTKSDRSSGVSSRSPRSSIVRPSSMLKKPKQRKKKSLKPASHPLVSDASSDNDHDSSTQSIELISLTPVTSLDRKRVTIIEDSMSSNEGDHHHRTIRSLLPNQNEGNMMNTESIHNPLNDPNLSQSQTNSNSNNSNNSHHSNQSNQSIGRIIQHLLQDQHRTTSEGSMSMFSNISEETIE